jgi:hypothetical protein
MPEVNGAAVLDTIASTLVLQEKYSSKEDALRALAQSSVRAKVAIYRRRIRHLQHKYGMDFAAFSRTLEGRATPQQEDDWFSWRSAISMLEEWQSVLLSLSHERADCAPSLPR